MKSKKRQEEKSKKAEARKLHGKVGYGSSKYALKQRIDNRPGSPFRTTIREVEEPEPPKKPHIWLTGTVAGGMS